MARKVLETMDKRQTRVAPAPEPGAPFEHQSELVLLAQTIVGEAEGEDYEGKLAVAYTAVNRMFDRRWGDSIAEVVLQKWQFSCFNAGSPRLRAMKLPLRWVGDDIWQDSFRAACAAFYGFEPDPTGGADHYCTTSVASKTAWAKDREADKIIGAHSFYKIRW